MSEPTEKDPAAARLARLDAEAERGGGEARIARQHREGKLTARERIARLLDPESFVELDRFKTHRGTDFGMHLQRIPGDGVVTGHGLVDGRPVFVFAQDVTVFGGSLSGAFAEKICKVMDLAVEVGAPVIGLYDSGGARIQEGVASLAGYAEIFLRQTLASGVVPQISVIMGPCAGGAVYGPAVTDFLFMVRGTGALFTSGPELVQAATGEVVDREALGGAAVHAERSGLAHFALEGEEATLEAVRELLGYLPARGGAEPPALPPADDPARLVPALRSIVPADLAEPYDVVEAIRAVVDGGQLLEVARDFARNVVVGLARLDGRPVGVVANQPAVLGGALDGDAAIKAARFVRCCDAFGLPVVTLVDVPGFLPGTAQEWGGLARHGAKLLYAFAEATVPKVTLVTRRAYGGAYAVMASKHLRADVNLAFPAAEIAVLPPEGAVSIIFRKELAAAADPAAERVRLAAEYRERYANPYQAAELGHVDQVIRPEETRRRIIQALALLRTKRRPGLVRRHGNIPL